MTERSLGWASAAPLLLGFALWAAAEGPADPPPDDEFGEAGEPAPDLEAPPAAPSIRPPVFQAPPLPPEPAAGKGRLNIALDGNRQWCTYRDDRVVQPPAGLESSKSRPRSHSPVYTFGYQFTIAAVARARPAETILLYESPVVRTAVLRQAGKLGRGGKKPPGPIIVAPHEGRKPAAIAGEQPGSLVPFWQEQMACTRLHDSFEFDLQPGAYDVYMAFDILARSGNWAHRSVGFLTDVVIEEGRRTRVDGRVDMEGGGRRQVELLSSALLPATVAGAGAAP